MSKWLVPFLVLDLIVAIAVLMAVVKIRLTGVVLSLNHVKSITSLDQLRVVEAFALEQHQRIGEYMRANWSGIPEQLPSVIMALLDELERDARGKGLAIERDAMKAMLASSLRAHHVGSGNERSEAFKRVA